MSKDQVMNKVLRWTKVSLSIGFTLIILALPIAEQICTVTDLNSSYVGDNYLFVMFKIIIIGVMFVIWGIGSSFLNTYMTYKNASDEVGDKE